MFCKGRCKWEWDLYRSLARVDVNGTRTLYRSFARVNIHMDVVICKGKYSRE